MNGHCFRFVALTALLFSIIAASTFGQSHGLLTVTPESIAPAHSLALECGSDIASPAAHYPVDPAQECWNEISSKTVNTSSYPPEIGDQRDFKINPWDSHTFTLRDKSRAHFLWVENSQLDRITDSTMLALKQGLIDSTPDGSYNSQQGIIDNLNNIFGRQVNDSDGLVDILFYSFISNNYYQDGYVISPDINGADVLFLNSNNSIYEKSREWMLGAVAHEYLHVIHVNYMDRDSWEIDFIAEGIAMVAMYATGYSDVWFSDEFLKSADDLNRPLLHLRAVHSGSQLPRYPDHMRAGLFHTYLAVQHGMPVLRELLHNSRREQGVANLEMVLAGHGTTLADALVDYHLANFLNEPALGRRYSYPDPALDPLNDFSFPALAEIRVADTPSAFTLHVAGDTTDTTPETRVNVQEGGVSYSVWEGVENFELSLDVTGPLGDLDLLRSRLRPHVVLEREDGSFELQGVEAGPESTTFTGPYKRISLALIHVDPEEVSDVEVAFSASWSSTPVALEKNELPAGARLAQNYPNPFNPSTTIEYSLSRSTSVRLAVYDMLGRELEVLVDDVLVHPGSYEVAFRSGDLPSGTYVLRLETDEWTVTRSMSLLR